MLPHKIYLQDRDRYLFHLISLRQTEKVKENEMTEEYVGNERKYKVKSRFKKIPDKKSLVK